MEEVNLSGTLQGQNESKNRTEKLGVTLVWLWAEVGRVVLSGLRGSTRKRAFRLVGERPPPRLRNSGLE